MNDFYSGVIFGALLVAVIAGVVLMVAGTLALFP